MTAASPNEVATPICDEAVPLPNRLLRLPEVMARVGMKASDNQPSGPDG